MDSVHLYMTKLSKTSLREDPTHAGTIHHYSPETTNFKRGAFLAYISLMLDFKSVIK